jgi:serine/threonine protein kinase
MIGRVIKGKYKIYDKVGSGGFSTVYLGRNMDTNEIIAIKVLGEQHAREPRYVERFRREAGLAERLQHKNVVRILDHGIEDGQHFLIMEFVEGLTLDQIIERRGPLPIGEALSYIRQACAGLDAAHQAGVVHRDIKPANLMITPEGEVKIMDFGIARLESMAGLTQSGIFMGTPRYISPEMAQGTGADIRSDLYALGLLLYEMLAGSPPFGADNPWVVLRQQIEEQIPPLHQVRPDVPEWLEAVIARATAKDPARRFQSPSEMLAGIERQTASPAGVPPAPLARTRVPIAMEAQPAGRRVSRGLIWGLAGAAAVITLGLAALFVFGLGGGTPTATPLPSEVSLVPTATPAPLTTNTPIMVVVTNTAEDTPVLTATEPLPTDMPLPPPTELPPSDTPPPTVTPTATSTATPSETATPIPTRRPVTPTPSLLASNVRDFSGTQGTNGWKYLMENGRNSGNWKEMRFGDYKGKRCWLTDNWETDVRICGDGELTPGMSTRVAYEWRTDVARRVEVRIYAQKIDTRCGDGIQVTVQRIVDGQGSRTLESFRVAADDSRGVSKHYTVDVGPGVFLFAFVDIVENSQCDASRLSIEVY